MPLSSYLELISMMNPSSNNLELQQDFSPLNCTREDILSFCWLWNQHWETGKLRFQTHLCDLKDHFHLVLSRIKQLFTFKKIANMSSRFKNGNWHFVILYDTINQSFSMNTEQNISSFIKTFQLLSDEFKSSQNIWNANLFRISGWYFLNSCLT